MYRKTIEIVHINRILKTSLKCLRISGTNKTNLWGFYC